MHEECVIEGLKFNPPVYIQRYDTVYKILLDDRWRTQIGKLVDFGCAEIGIFTYLKRATHINEISFVDIDEESISYHKWKVRPLTAEHLKKRCSPLKVTVFAGSVADPDYRLYKTDVVTAIELIEHLYPDVLHAFPYNIFGYIEPKIVIVTTPNADFNVFFTDNGKKFRHYDHKFEWSRAQFEDWANNIVARYPDYFVTFSGIGKGPGGTEHRGECSQMAVFVRKDLIEKKYVTKLNVPLCQCNRAFCGTVCEASNILCSCLCIICSPNSYGLCTYSSYSKQFLSNTMKDNFIGKNYYKQVEMVEFPYEVDNRTEEEKIIAELRYRIFTLGGTKMGSFYVEERNRAEIPIHDLLYGNIADHMTQLQVIDLLHDQFKIEECLIEETGKIEKCVIFDHSLEEVSSSSEESDSDGYSRSPVFDDSSSDWD